MKRISFLPFLLLSLLAYLSACGGNASNPYLDNNSPRWANFPVELNAAGGIADDADTSADLMDAMAFWENKAGKRLFDYKGLWNGATPPIDGTLENPSAIYANVIFFQSPWTYGDNVKGKTAAFSTENVRYHSFIMLNPSGPYCHGDCATAADDGRISMRKLLAHELGHFLGLPHVDDAENIMYPDIQAGGDLSHVTIDAERFRNLTR